MTAESNETAAIDELREILDENPEILNELDRDLIQLCKELGAI